MSPLMVGGLKQVLATLKKNLALRLKLTAPCTKSESAYLRFKLS